MRNSHGASDKFHESQSTPTHSDVSLIKSDLYMLEAIDDWYNTKIFFKNVYAILTFQFVSASIWIGYVALYHPKGLHDDLHHPLLTLSMLLG